MPEHTGASYEPIAQKYIQAVDTNPMNVLYERPATCSLLPPLAGLQVLDAGCGSGWYAEYLLGQGAAVTSIDLNADFVAHTRQRTAGKAEVFQADLSQPLTFAENERFDLVLCPLVLHYLKDWLPTLREYQRILKPGGYLVFSTHHPFMDWKLFNRDNYFAIEQLEDEWKVGKVQFYRRPLTAISAALQEAGFVIERLLEPQPDARFLHDHPEWTERLTKNPWFLFVRARKITLPSME